MTFRSLFAFLVLLAPLAGTSSAQGFVPTFGEERESFIYDFARPGQATITVYVWGQISRPGIWKIEPGTNLIELLSAALVPGVDVEEPTLRQITAVKVYRGSGEQRRKVYEAQLRDLLTDAQATYPTLQDGDILEVELEQETRFTFQTFVQYLGTVSALTLLVLRLLSIGSN